MPTRQRSKKGTRKTSGAKKRSKKLSPSQALTERRALLREYRQWKTGDPRRQEIIARVDKLRDVIFEGRSVAEAREREVLMSRDRVRQLRQYVEGYEPDDGYDQRAPNKYSKQQLAHIDRDWKLLIPVLSKSHIRVVAQARDDRGRFASGTDKKKVKLLAEFQGLRKLPRGMKAVPITTPTPANTTIEVTSAGEVLKHRGALVERYYFFNKAEKRSLTSTGRIEAAVRSLLARMPAGRYFALTGEHEAFQAGLQHRGAATADDPDNLLLRQVQFWIGIYPEDMHIWFRGFRWIGSVTDDEAGKRERTRIIKQRQSRERERAERRMELKALARKRARREVPIK